MGEVVFVSFKGYFRDRIFYAILSIALLFFLIPSISTLSMRQVVELSLTLSTSLTSSILLLIAVFLGGTSLWRDIERRFCYSFLGLPLKRSSYVLGKFYGVALFLLLTALLLAVVACGVVYVTASLYPSARPLIWSNIGLLFLFEALKYILLVACAFFFASVSTSFFLPIFGTVAIFLVGNVSQQVYDYVHSSAGQTLPELSRYAATALYYVLPNFSAFDLKAHAIYSIPIEPHGVMLTGAYFVVYGTMVLYLTIIAYTRRELL